MYMYTVYSMCVHVQCAKIGTISRGKFKVDGKATETLKSE